MAVLVRRLVHRLPESLCQRLQAPRQHRGLRPREKLEAKPKPRPLKVEPPKVEAKKEVDEYEDEEIEFEGVKYMLRGDVVYGIDDEKIKGRLTEEGDVELA